MPLIERALARAGVDITVVTTDDDGPGKHLAVQLGPELDVAQASTPASSSGVPPQVLGVDSRTGTVRELAAEDGCATRCATRIYFRKQTEFYKVSVPLWQWLRRNADKFDIVHIHALFSFASVAAARCARSRAVPYVIRPLGVLNQYGMTKRRPALKRFSFQMLERPLLKQAAGMHYTSKQEQVEAEASGAVARPFIVPLGLDLLDFQTLPGPARFMARWPVAAGRELVLFLSRLDPKKGLDRLMDAFAEVKRGRSGALLVIAGEGEEGFVRELKHRAETLGIAQDILWTGFLDGEDKLAALAAAKVFVLPSYSENFGIAAVEALAAGVPTVLTTGVGIADDVQQNNAGVVVSPNAAEIASGIERFLSDPVLASRVSSNGRQLARARYSLDAMGAALKTLYESVLAEAQSR